VGQIQLHFQNDLGQSGSPDEKNLLLFWDSCPNLT
jgi:hypothetical protein